MSLTQQQKVAEFHQKYGFAIGALKFKRDQTATVMLDIQGIELQRQAAEIKADAIRLQTEGDPRLYRAHLMMEELGEFLVAMSKMDLVAMADGSADLKYVTHGADVTFGIPGDEVFDEVHRSNMTKQARTPDNLRMSSKGPDYQPPRIREILEKAGVL